MYEYLYACMFVLLMYVHMDGLNMHVSIYLCIYWIISFDGNDVKAEESIRESCREEARKVYADRLQSVPQGGGGGPRGWFVSSYFCGYELLSSSLWTDDSSDAGSSLEVEDRDLLVRLVQLLEQAAYIRPLRKDLQENEIITLFQSKEEGEGLLCPDLLLVDEGVMIAQDDNGIFNVPEINDVVCPLYLEVVDLLIASVECTGCLQYLRIIFNCFKESLCPILVNCSPTRSQRASKKTCMRDC